MEENKEVNGFSPLFDPIYIEDVNTTLNPEGEKSIHVLSIIESDNTDNDMGSTSRLSIQILKQKLDDSLQVKNPEEAMKYILDNVQENSEIDMNNAVKSSLLPYNALFYVFFNISANLIAQDTRRGVANVIIVGKKIGKILKSNKSNLIFDKSITLYKNYEYIGSYKTSNVFIDNTGTIPENKAILAYNGEGLLDKGLFLTLSENKDFFYMSTNYGNWTDYFKVLSFNIPKESIIDKIKNKFKTIFKR